LIERIVMKKKIRAKRQNTDRKGLTEVFIPPE
jgi:hypothetical protein